LVACTGWFAHAVKFRTDEHACTRAVNISPHPPPIDEHRKDRAGPPRSGRQVLLPLSYCYGSLNTWHQRPRDSRQRTCQAKTYVAIDDGLGKRCILTGKKDSQTTRAVHVHHCLRMGNEEVKVKSFYTLSSTFFLGPKEKGVCSTFLGSEKWACNKFL
jgi:hypothetical protein